MLIWLHFTQLLKSRCQRINYQLQSKILGYLVSRILPLDRVLFVDVEEPYLLVHTYVTSLYALQMSELEQSWW